MLERPDVTAEILIVEDELIVSADIAARLKRMGYRIAGQTDSASSAIEFCEKSKPDLVLMDIRLKGAIDGIAAAERLRIDHQIPIIFLTAHADESTLQRAKVSEPYGYVLKPFEERELRIAIEMTLYRAKSQQQLNQSRSELAAILNSIGDAVIAIDVNEHVSYLNPVAELLTGADQSQIKGLPFSEIAICYEPNTENPLSLKQLVAAQGSEQRKEVLLRTSSGAEFTVMSTVSQLRSATGVAEGNVLVFRDITQQRRLEETLQQSQKMEALGQLAVGIAHDLNNILTVICVNNSLLIEAAKCNSVEFEQLNCISQAADRAVKMTNQLLAIGKNQMIVPETLDLDTVVRNCIPLLKRLLPENVGCHYVSAECPLPVVAGQSQVEQIVLNLLLNARNSMMPDGGTITVRTSRVENELELPQAGSNREAGYSAVLEVEDTGCGMDLATQQRIWEPFFSSNSAGTGLGLAVVYGKVQQAGGTVSVSSSKGKGSVFRVCLPSP